MEEIKMSEQIKKVTLIDEYDQPFELVVVATLKINDTEYAILNDEEDDEDYIFKIEKIGDEEQFEIVEDEEELQEVIDAYYELND
jgi:hypothetical protein